MKTVLKPTSRSYKVGLKLYSCNMESIPALQRCYDKGILDYVELLVYVLYAYREQGAEIASQRPWRVYADGSFDAMFLTTAGQAWWREQDNLIPPPRVRKRL